MADFKQSWCTLLISFAFVQVSAASWTSKTSRRGLGDTCLPTTNETCTAAVKNSYCQSDLGEPSQGTCICLPTHVAHTTGAGECTQGENSTTCLRKATTLEDRCSVDVQCTASSELGLLSHCDGGKCRCTPDAVKGTWRCLQKLNLWDNTEDEAQCSHIIYGTFDALEGRCKCQAGRVGLNGTDICYKAAKKLGHSCQVNAVQCTSIPNAVCDDTTKSCRCPDDTYVSDVNNSTCLLSVDRLHEECSQPFQCRVEHSTCGAHGQGISTCVCIPTHVESETDENTCVPKTTVLNEPCTENVQCYSSLREAECKDSTCQCKPNTVIFSGKCYVTSSLGQICELHQQCNAGTVCRYSHSTNDNRCTCPTGTTELEGNCFSNIDINESCQVDEDCRASIPGNVSCDTSSRKCACNTGSLSSSDWKKCLISRVGIGSECAESKQCVGVSESTSLCSKAVHRCTCRPCYGFVSNDSKLCEPTCSMAGTLEASMMFTSVFLIFTELLNSMN